MKKFFLLFLIFFFLLNFADFVFAQFNPPPEARKLEVTYPPIEKFAPETVKTPLPRYTKYIFMFVIMSSGFVALAVLIYAGFHYLISAGRPEVLKDAKEQIFAALFGLLILFGSWLLLYNINPQIVEFYVPALKPPLLMLHDGVWLCKSSQDNEFSSVWQLIEKFKEKEKELERAASEKQREDIINQLIGLYQQIKELLKKINEKCYLVGGLGHIKEDFDKSGNYVTHVYLVPKQIDNNKFKNYAAILFEEKAFEGKNQLVYTLQIHQTPLSKALSDGPNPIEKPSSIIPFVINPKPDPDWQVTTFEEVDFNKGFEKGTKKEQVFPDECNNQGSYWCAGRLEPSPKSIKNPGGAGRYIAILTKDETYSSSEVFGGSDSNLLDNDLIINWDCAVPIIRFRCVAKPAAKIIFLISGKIY